VPLVFLVVGDLSIKATMRHYTYAADKDYQDEVVEGGEVSC